MTKKLYVKTYGCQMNVYDSERMTEILAPLGYIASQTPEDADLVILNTCHIREKATEKVFSDIGRLRPFKTAKEDHGDKMIIAVAGCVAQAEGDEILSRAPLVDMVFGPQTYHRLPEMLARLERGETRKIINTDFPIDDKFDTLPQERLVQDTVSAFLTIQEGCDKFCTFCVVPYTRGSEISRPVSQILAEAQSLARKGIREITLLGQNVNAYHGLGPDQKIWSLGRLIRVIAEIEGLDRIRYTTSHPRDMDGDLIMAHQEIPALMPYLHLPVQSGSDKILAAMNRKHSADDYRRIVDKLRAARSDLALSSDFIIGFPGESDQDFAETLRLITEIGYAGAFSFKYSERPGTPAAGLGDKVEESVKSDRLRMVQQLLESQQTAFNSASCGKTLPVLFEKPGRQPDQVVGRSPYLQPVHVTLPAGSSLPIGQIIDCKITEVSGHSLFADYLWTEADIQNSGNFIKSQSDKQQKGISASV